MDLKLTNKNYVFLALIFLSIILWAYFLNETGLMLKEMLNLGELENVIGKLKSTAFLFFVFTFPISIALNVIHSKIEENKINSFIVGLGGTAIGLIVSMLLFSNLQGYLLVGVFYLIGRALTIELIYTKKLELKKYVSFRLLGTGIHRTGTILAIGLFLIIAITVNSNQEIYEQQIDQQLLEVAGGEQTTEQLTELFVDSMIETQKQTAQQIIELPQFQALENSPDPNAVAFHQAILIQKDYLNSIEYRQKIEEEISKKQNLGDNELQGVLDSVKQQMPVFGIMTDFLWLIMGFAFFSAVLLLSNTIFYVLVLVYGIIIEQIYEMTIKR
ncbi:MAG: hypothetical protein COT90_05630 [Candidatus Diapherotrites archaeon CG10_big_fil_rev_8_21_14_0_10_31_34]|nr:MAG: hypothetical protein COT90_05630 [Candidatus Diapherotrites archaeon CG10_big_fil_rev_8_21_14_0_10_31_34]